MALPTWIDSINGHAGSLPFHPDPGIALDASDIYVTGSTGNTINTEMQVIANGMKSLTVEELTEEDQYRIRIGNFSF